MIESAYQAHNKWTARSQASGKRFLAVHDLFTAAKKIPALTITWSQLRLLGPFPKISVQNSVRTRRTLHEMLFSALGSSGKNQASLAKIID